MFGKTGAVEQNGCGAWQADRGGRLVWRYVSGASAERKVGRRVPGGRLLLWVMLIVLAVVGVIGSLGEEEVSAEELPFRLHIVANSDSAVDQALKLQVRDAVVEYMTPLLQGVDSAVEAEQVVNSELGALRLLVEGMCREYGYGAAAMLGSFDFPDRRYGKTVVPAGEYRALRIVLGEGAGHNWWCVLFPPLCFVDECGEVAEAEGGRLRQGQRVVRLKMAEIFNR